MKPTYIAAAILAWAGASPVLAADHVPGTNGSAPIMEGAGPVDTGASVSSEMQITTPTVPQLASPPPITTPTVRTTVPAPIQIPGDAESVRQVQQQLNARGFYTPIDGVWGAQTRSALQQFQRVRGFNVTGSLDQRTVAALGGTASSQAIPGPTTGALNPNVPSSIPNPSGVGSTPSSIGNPSGVGAGSITPSVGARSNITGSSQAGMSTGNTGLGGGARAGAAVGADAGGASAGGAVSGGAR